MRRNARPLHRLIIQIQRRPIYAKLGVPGKDFCQAYALEQIENLRAGREVVMS